MRVARFAFMFVFTKKPPSCTCEHVENLILSLVSADGYIGLWMDEDLGGFMEAYKDFI